jgi:hypothetical protein
MESTKIDLQTPQIKVLTLHAAKGLEFPFVAITRLKQGDLPHTIDGPAAEREAELAKARRLFYVGCTRAMRELFVSADAEQPSEFVLDLHPPQWRVMQESDLGKNRHSPPHSAGGSRPPGAAGRALPPSRRGAFNHTTNVESGDEIKR